MPCLYCYTLFFFFFKQKTAYEMRISDWSSDVCSSDLVLTVARIDDGHFCKRLKVVVSTPVGGQVGKSLPHWLQAPTTEVVAEKARNVQPKSCAVSRNLGRQIRFSALGTS